jgi:hypothetical protein
MKCANIKRYEVQVPPPVAVERGPPDLMRCRCFDRELVESAGCPVGSTVPYQSRSLRGGHMSWSGGQWWSVLATKFKDSSSKLVRSVAVQSYLCA